MHILNNKYTNKIYLKKYYTCHGPYIIIINIITKIKISLKLETLFSRLQLANWQMHVPQYFLVSKKLQNKRIFKSIIQTN